MKPFGSVRVVRATIVRFVLAAATVIALTGLFVCMKIQASYATASASHRFGHDIPGTRVAPATPMDSLWHEQSQELLQPPGHLAMLEKLKEHYRREQIVNTFLGETNLHRLRARMENVGAMTVPRDRFLLYHELAMEELNQGNDALAIKYLDICWEIFTSAGVNVAQQEVEEFVFDYGLANLRFGETQNCCSRKGPDNCVLPIQSSGIHTKQRGSRRAIEIFSTFLQHVPRDRQIYWRALWLLNIAYMTVDAYPAEVPEAFLIPPAAFESEEPFPRFPNIAQRVGLDLYGLAGGVIADDFNNDGHLDLVISGWDLGTQIRIFINNQDGTFTEHTKRSGLEGIVGGSNLMQADYNNDGYVDIFLMRGGWLGNGGVQPISLLRNNGDGTFTDVTIDSGLGGAVQPSQSGGWADYDNDGWLDLFVCGEYLGDWQKPIQGDAEFASCRLFHNNGDGTFTDVTEQAGVENFRFAKGASWGDYDGDRFPDLYVSNQGQPNRLYHNNGDGTFTDVAEELSVTRPMFSFSCWFWDVNNDGLLDIYVSAYKANPEDIAYSYVGLNPQVERACLYLGQPGGKFVEVSQQYNLRHPNAPMGANFGDLDNDGYLDFYLGTGRPPYWALMSNLMFHNRGGKSFANVTTAGGFGNLQKGHGIAFADFDNDGDQDVFSQMGGAIRADKFYDTLYENPGFGNHWLSLQLVGTLSNRSAIGARIRAEIVEDGKRREVFKHVNSGASFGASPLRQTIGLGSAERIERLEIYWPTTDKTEVYLDVPSNAHLQIVEGEGRYTETFLRTYRLGGAGRVEDNSTMAGKGR